MECYSAIKRKKTPDRHNNMGEFQKHYVEQQKPDTKGKSIIPFLRKSGKDKSNH